MKVSVAMATYNGEKYIVEQLESIRTQTMPVDEVRICDDCSRDNTVEIVREYIKSHGLENAWSIDVNIHNLGYASNFIKAVKQTKGEYVFFCDQDDIWVPDRIEKMVYIMDIHSHIMLLGSEFEPFASTTDAPTPPKWELNGFKNDGTLEQKKFNAKNIFIGCQGCTMCIRRKLLNKTLAYWYDGWAHDEYVWKMALCMDGLYMYHSYTLKRRLHSTNVTMHKEHDVDKRLKYLEDLNKSHEATLKYIYKHGSNPKRVRLMRRNIKATKLRIALINDKKYLNTLKLMLVYPDCYHKRRAIPIEMLMALKS